MITIRNHTRRDIKYRVKWLNNPKIIRYIGFDHIEGTSMERQKEWFDNYYKTKDKKYFTICNDNIPIGWMGLSFINLKNKNANIFIAIGDDIQHGKGFGSIAINWLIDYAFNRLNLHKVMLQVDKNNLSAIRLYDSVGFDIEGCLKDNEFYDSKYHDLILMALIKSES